jgi:zinc transporter
MHLDRSDFDARRWLRDTSGIDSIIVDSLLAKGSRPRTTVIGQSLLVFLRGINLNPEEDPVHMVSMRMYAEEKRVVTIRRQHLMAVDDVKDSLEGGNGPLDAGDLLIAVAGALTERMRPKLTELKEELEALEARRHSARDHRAAPLPGAPARGPVLPLHHRDPLAYGPRAHASLRNHRSD